MVAMSLGLSLEGALVRDSCVKAPVAGSMLKVKSAPGAEMNANLPDKSIVTEATLFTIACATGMNVPAAGFTAYPLTLMVVSETT